MQLKIELFENDMGEALEPGVYQIEIQKGIKKEILYIGESVYPLVRCSEHLYNLKMILSILDLQMKQLKILILH